MHSKTVHVVVSGRVQGVGYRAWTKANARKRGLSGWVRNRQDGSVEAVFAGATDQVDDMLTACKEGPLACRVRDISVSTWDDAPTQEFEMKETV
ncbi:MAG: acylphosphatase [Rickettsiales bacterium]|nr:acylphosphatase [Rickettsiales bacterium]|tara:strand:- start:456 stop:737 length:282 start_codon:yes stop_codon:yes gene_type:complete